MQISRNGIDLAKLFNDGRLKCCPWCGGLPAFNGGFGSMLFCLGCGATGPSGQTDQEVVSRWNDQLKDNEK